MKLDDKNEFWSKLLDDDFTNRDIIAYNGIAAALVGVAIVADVSLLLTATFIACAVALLVWAKR